MYSEIADNKRKTVIIMVAFFALVGGLVWVFDLAFARGSLAILLGGLIGSLLYVIITYFAGSSMALAVNGAQEIQKRDNPRLYRLVENLAIADGLPTPRVFIMDDPSPNAFATGRDPRHAAVCATSGILQIMDDRELEGVLAHELGHIKNYDIRVSMIAFALTAIISLLADAMLRLTWFSNDDSEDNNQLFLILGVVAAILAPIIATLIQLAVSRQREYLADATGALTTRFPEGLASALEKISQTGSTLSKQNTATAHLFFANPLKSGNITSLFSTHPPIEERIARLRSMGTHA